VIESESEVRKRIEDENQSVVKKGDYIPIIVQQRMNQMIKEVRVE
jgi:hypothetical protein